MQLVRFLEKASIWADLEDVVELDPVSTPLEILIDAFSIKGSGVSSGASYFSCNLDDPENIARMVAAYISNRKDMNGLSIGVIPIQAVQSLNVVHQKTQGAGLDRSFVAESHYDVRVRNVDEAIKLANILRADIRKIAQKDVERHLCFSIRKGWVPMTELKPELLVLLAKRNLLTVLPPAPIVGQSEAIR